MFRESKIHFTVLDSESNVVVLHAVLYVTLQLCYVSSITLGVDVTLRLKS